jgi:transposase
MVYGDLSQAQWGLIFPLLPPRNKRGRPRADDRRTLNGILWVLRTGTAWNDMPRRYGADSTCHKRLKEWQEQGVWKRVLDALLSSLDEQGKLDWRLVYVDATFVPAKRGASWSARQERVRAQK